MVRVQHSFAGKTAIKAVVMARRGITAPKRIFPGDPGGILRQIRWAGIDPSILTDVLVALR